MFRPRLLQEKFFSRGRAVESVRIDCWFKRHKLPGERERRRRFSSVSCQSNRVRTYGTIIVTYYNMYMQMTFFFSPFFLFLSNFFILFRVNIPVTRIRTHDTTYAYLRIRLEFLHFSALVLSSE